MSALKYHLKYFVSRILGKDPEAVVLSVLSGDPRLCASMYAEFRSLVPERRHFVAGFDPPGAIEGATFIRLRPGSTAELYRQLRRRLRRFRVGQAAVLFSGESDFRPLRLAAFLLAPHRILAYNSRLERHHLRFSTLIASVLFLRGVPLDRIFLRPLWLCPWKKDRSFIPTSYRILAGRPFAATRPKVAVLTPYFPYPLSHGGAVRIFHLLREAAREFDVLLFAFQDDERLVECGPVLEFCARVILVGKPRYREPRWSSLLPPEVCEYYSPTMQRLLGELAREYSVSAVQVEYTQLASYAGDILVEHDVTFDLYRQVWQTERSLRAWWDLVRWMRFERRAVRRFRAVVAMSEKDAEMLGVRHVRVIENGVDLERFRPEPERDGQRLLFIGSFRHFPNIIAYRFLVEEVWPRLRRRFPEMTLTVVAGPEAYLYWKATQNTPAPPVMEGVRMLEFVPDVRPLYVECNLVLAPTLVSAGTNIKVLEAMAMERAVVATKSGCAGLSLEHGTSVWIANDATGFVEGVARLISDTDLRRRISQNARRMAEGRFDWKCLGAKQRSLWRQFASADIEIRYGRAEDLRAVSEIQAVAAEAASWAPSCYLSHRFLVALVHGELSGFLVCREVCPGEYEILNLAVAPAKRRQGIATALLRSALAEGAGCYYLEVRESNCVARQLYRKLGFKEVGIRPSYYQDPEENAIVMRFYSC